MNLHLLTSLIWITAAIATPVSVIPSAPPEQKDGRKESVDHYNLPLEIRSYLMPLDAEIPGEQNDEVESSHRAVHLSNEEETHGALKGRELPEFYAPEVNGSVVKESLSRLQSLPEEELPSQENAEYFGKKMTANSHRKNPENSLIYNVTSLEREKSENNSQDMIVFMNFKGSQKFLNNSATHSVELGDEQTENISTSPATRNDSESLENIKKNSQRTADYYDDQGDESVLSEVIKSYEEIRTPFEEINNRAVNGTVLEYEKRDERKQKLQTGIFSRPIVVAEENYGTSTNESVDSNQQEIIFGDKSSTLPKEISMAESNNHKRIMSSSTILNPLRVGIAMMNLIPEDQKIDKPRKENESKYSDNPIEESKEELLLSDEPSSNKVVEQSKKSEGSVEIQKSVELYHNAPIQEIHYPVEYTSHIYTVPQMDHTRGNILRNEIETLKSLDEQNAENPSRFVPEEESLGFQYSLNRVTPEETQLNIVPQPTIYVQSVQEQQNSLHNYGERKQLTQVVPEEYPTSGNESQSDKINNENAATANRNQPEYTLYQFRNLQILYNKAKKEIEKDAREENKNTVNQYVVEYQKSVEPQEYVSQQVINYQPVESQQDLYRAPDGQRNVYQPIDNRQNVYQLPENQQNIYQTTDKEQNIYQLPENQQNIYQTTDNEQNIYQLPENQRNVYQSSDNQRNIYQSPEKQQIIYQSTNNQQSIYQPAENQQNVYQSTNNQQSIYQAAENQQNVYQSTDNQQNIYQPAENQQNVYQSTDNQQNIYQPPGNPGTIYSSVKFHPERTRENLPRPQSENNSPPERYANEKYVHKPPQVPYQDISYPIRQGVLRQEVIEHPFAIPLRHPVNPMLHKHVILPVSSILPYSIQRFMVQPPGVAVRSQQPYYTNKIEVSGSRESSRPKSRPRPSIESEKAPKYKSPVPERTSNVQNTIRYSPGTGNHRQNVSNILQLYDYVYDAPLFTIGKERGNLKRDQPKKPQSAMQFEEDESRQVVPRLSFSVRPPSPQVALNFHAGNRKRQAMYGPAKNRSSKDSSEPAGFFLRQNPSTGLKVTRQLEGRNSIGSFRQSKMEYGFKPPMVPSVQYDEETATKVDS